MSETKQSKPRVFKKIIPTEVSYVDDGANMKEFLIYKRDKKKKKCDDEDEDTKEEEDNNETNKIDKTLEMVNNIKKTMKTMSETEMAILKAKVNNKTKETENKNIQDNIEKGGDIMTEKSIVENIGTVEPVVDVNERVDIMKDINANLDEIKKDNVNKVATEMGVDTSNKEAMEKVEKIVEVTNTSKSQLDFSKENPISIAVIKEAHEKETAVLKNSISELQKAMSALNAKLDTMIPVRKTIVETSDNTRPVESPESLIQKALEPLSNPEMKDKLINGKDPIGALCDALRGANVKL